MMAPAEPKMEGRFWAKVNKDGAVVRPELGACWEWTGAKHRDGYGSFGVGGKKTALAHRVSWEIVIGDIPQGAFVCHKCDRPCCVNPGHLFLGDNQSNMDDKVAKGRQSRCYGERSGKAVLTDDKVREIRRLKGTAPSRVVAARFNVCSATIRHIWRGIIWCHLL